MKKSTGVAFSVIVPTFNNRRVLSEVLNALEAQVDAPAFEIIVVNDGSKDGTREFLDARRFRVPAIVCHQDNAGPAAARNQGISRAQGELVAFLGDDIIPASTWLAVHWRAQQHFHAIRPCAVIGYTGWHPRVKVTRFLSYINEYGLQFGYRLIRFPIDLPFNFFYTSNVSLSRSLLARQRFDEGFPYPAWEDAELSYRLKKNGLTLIYEPTAKAAHDHPTDFRRFADRQEKAGFCAVVFYRRHPELGPFLGLGPAGPPPVGSFRRRRALTALIRLLEPLPLSIPTIWEKTLNCYYIQGLHRGWKAMKAGRG